MGASGFAGSALGVTLHAQCVDFILGIRQYKQNNNL